MSADSPQRAARLTDPIGHGPGILGMMGGMVVGAVVGAALIAAAPVGAVVAVAMATCAAVGCVAGGGLAGGQLVRGFQKACGLPDPQTGVIGPMTSPNVRIGKLFAARVLDKAIACDGLMSCAHFPMPLAPIADGAKSVRINGLPAARVTSKLVCGAAIKDGEPTVQIGGPTKRVLAVHDPEEEAKAQLEGLMTASLIGVFLLNPAVIVSIAEFVVLNEGVGILADEIWGADSGARDIAQGLLGFGALGLALRGARGGGGKEFASKKGSGRGEVADANFAQSKIRADESFSEQGSAKYSELAGKPVKTVNDLAAALNDGSIDPSQVPVDYVVTKDGTKLILNTRTSVALDRAGLPKSEWYGTDKTGVEVPGEPGTTFDDLAADQLRRNRLPPTGSPDIPKGREK